MSPTASRPSPYRLLIFDWDGTLLDSIGAIVGCTQAALGELGLPAVDEDEIRGVIGLGLRETVETIRPGCDEDTFWSIVRAYRELWLGGWDKRPVLFDGVERLLGDLAGRGHVLAVATAKGRHGLDNDLGRTGLAGMFETTRTVDEAPSKPNPAMILDILEETGFATQECLMIGDTVHDLQMAANAGVDAVGVSSGSVDHETLLDTTALTCLPSVLGLPEWLAARSG